MTTIAFIGFGEAAQSIAGGLGGRNAARLAAYDLRFNDPAASGALRARAAELGVEPLDDVAGSHRRRRRGHGRAESAGRTSGRGLARPAREGAQDA